MDKKTLREYRALCRRIQCYQEERDTLISRQYPVFSGKSMGNGNAISKPVERTAEALEKLQKNYTERIGELEQKRYSIETVINALPHPDAELMQRRYFLGQTWAEVADSMGYSEAHILRLHGRILKKITSSKSC